jgi:NAD(P)-dependent dehydrogenase (short-subunit alcohol dehydrogenase family)
MAEPTELERILAHAPGTLDLFRLDGRVALVVGGTRGLGQAMAWGGRRRRRRVRGERAAAGLQETADAITSLGRRGTCFAADVTDEAQVERMVAFVLETYGRIDILVNSQGIVALQPIAEFDTDTWQRIMDVNVRSVFLCCKHVGRVMLEQGKGKIINVSSVRGFQGRAEDPAYAPSKGAVNQLTRSLAIEWGPRGINVNSLAPVFTRTALAAPVLDDPERLAWVLGRIALKRLGELEDQFGPIVFLASEASNFVHGHCLMVDGGWLAT